MSSQKTDDSMAAPLPRISDETLGALLRATGARPAAPPERENRVRSAAWFVFKSLAERRARRRRIGIAVALAAASVVAVPLGIAWLRSTGRAPGESFAHIERAAGPARIRTIRMGLMRQIPPRPGEALTTGSEAATESGGFLAFKLASGHSVRLGPESQVGIVSERVLHLERGALYVDSNRPTSDPVDSLEIRTELGTIRETGTQFEVRVLEATLRVRVREGAVSLRRGEAGVEVPAGRELEIDPSGVTRERELSAFGPEWDWVGEIAPPMEIQGRTLREFLDWAARERGLQLRFATGGLSESASQIVLSGSIDGLTLDQALDSVLLTCRMGRRVEAESLWIEGLDPGERDP